LERLRRATDPTDTNDGHTPATLSGEEPYHGPCARREWASAQTTGFGGELRITVAQLGTPQGRIDRDQAGNLVAGTDREQFEEGCIIEIGGKLD
jgi:hypothetical protein